MKIIDLLNKDITQQELLNYYNATIIYDFLPKMVNGFVMNYKGLNLIVINKNLSYYKKKKTILHELAHIELSHLGQLDKDLLAFRIETCEDEADNYIKMLMLLIKNNNNDDNKIITLTNEFD